MPIDSRPYNPYPAQGDIPTGTYLAMGIIAAYVKRLRAGVGDNVTAHLYSAGIWHAVAPIISAQEPYNNPWPKDPIAIFSPMNCSYKTADEHWVTLCGNGWASWPRLVKAAGWPEEMSTNYPNLIPKGRKAVVEEINEEINFDQNMIRSRLILLPYKLQVGQAGVMIKPKLYIGFGVSGAVNHITGVDADKFVAENQDPTAPIFNYCDYGIVGEMDEVCDMMIRQFKAHMMN